jgi:transcriptional regulator with XRE-family HTH domain
MARGRQSTEVEFLRTLRRLMGLNQAEFAKACGKRQSNMSAYLSGQSQPGKKVLASCVRHLFEWAVQPIREIEPIPRLNDLPKTAGLYILYDSAGAILYVGKAKNFRAEVRQTLGRRLPEPLRFGPKLSKRRPFLRDVAFRLSLYEILSPRLRHNLEAMFLRSIANQTHNSNIGKAR